jgi:hypothetical protein
MEPEGSLYSQESVIGPYPQPDKSTPHPHISVRYVLLLYYNLHIGILSDLLLSRIFYKSYVCISPFSHACYMPSTLYPSRLSRSNMQSVH